MKKHFLRKSLAVLAILALFPVQTMAIGFDSGHIISDHDLFLTDTMSVQDIQAFLEKHSGTLKNHFDTDIDGLLKTAAMIIHDAAERHQINPQVLLVKLQKEQSLITDPTPKETQYHWATGYGVCDDCDVTHPSVVRFKGFAKQVDNTAEFLRYVTENPDRFYFRPGEEYTISGEKVVIQNAATATLYNYTPHLHGNQIFFKLWQSWFGSVLSHPDGTLLQAFGEPGVWLIKNGKRHAFKNLSSLTSRYDISQIVQVPPNVVAQYQTGPAISYPEYSLLRLESGKTYLLVNNQLRWIVDNETLRQLGFLEDEITDVTAAEISFFGEGDPITLASLDPTGALVQDPDTYGIYYVQDGAKYPLIAPELLSLNFPHLKVRKGTAEELNRYAKGAPVKLKDGLLVKAPHSPVVYVIANGMKHAIDSEATFNALGYNWLNIKTVTAKLLEIHPDGDELSVEPISDEEAAELVDTTS